jgi:hypothetical protein
VVLDNFGIPDSQQVRLTLKSVAGSKISPHFLPLFSPIHDQIERVWKDLHDKVTRNKRCAGLGSSWSKCDGIFRPGIDKGVMLTSRRASSEVSGSRIVQGDLGCDWIWFPPRAPWRRGAACG